MAGPGLSTTNDATYADSGTDASVKQHQIDHDKVHGIVNYFDVNGGVLINTRTASYTLVAGDAQALVEMNLTTANTWTVPANVFTAGQYVQGCQYGTGLTTVTAGTGVTVRSRGGVVASAGQYAEWTVTFRSATEAVLSGDLA